MRRLTARQIITMLKLKPLEIEGGYFVETYRAQERIAHSALPKRYRGRKPFATAIYYLLTPGSFSAMHRLRSDEIFHFYAGDPVELLLLAPRGRAERAVLGTDLARGQRPQIVVPRGVWQGARLIRGGTWALLGTTVAPGFEYADFELGRRRLLLKRYPRRAALIAALTRS
jgi:hypothetical protein